MTVRKGVTSLQNPGAFCVLKELWGMMVNPQKENGYTPIANEIMEALIKYRIPGQQMQCLLLIIRKTYGFRKKVDIIALSQFVKYTKLKRQHAFRALKELENKNIIVTKFDYKGGKTYRFNKNYSQWKVYPKKVTVTKKGVGVTKKGSVCNQIRGPQKKKETITKEIPVFDIISYLNKKTNSRFKHTTDETIKKISGRWADGYKLTDFRYVIDVKCDEWLDTDYEKYLCPDTLFRPSNFEKYRNQKKESKECPIL